MFTWNPSKYINSKVLNGFKINFVYMFEYFFNLRLHSDAIPYNMFYGLRKVYV